jgi:hypothetical protein
VLRRKKHDVIGIKLYDKMDMQLPDAGLLQVRDSENKKTRWVDSGDSFVRHSYEQEFFRVAEYCTQTFKKPVATCCTYVPVMIM